MKKEVLGKMIHCFSYTDVKERKKRNSSVPVKEIDYHVHRGVSFHIKDAEM